MFAEYLAAAMRHAHYEFIAEDNMYFGAIDELPGSWVGAPILEECQQRMAIEAEEWILFAIVRHQDLPVIDDHKLALAKAGD